MLAVLTTKIAISLPDDLVAAARKAVADGRAASISAFVANAIEEHGRYEELAVLLSEMAAERRARRPRSPTAVLARRSGCPEWLASRSTPARLIAIERGDPRLQALLDEAHRQLAPFSLCRRASSLRRGAVALARPASLDSSG